MRTEYGSTGAQLVTRIDLDAPLPTLPRATAKGQPYRRALAVVRLHGIPLEILEIEVSPGVRTPPQLLAALLWARIRDAVNTHLLEDGLAPVDSLDPWTGIAYRENHDGPSCRRYATAGLTADDVTVVVPTVGRTESLTRLVTSVLDGSNRAHGVIVVNNRPGDTTIGMAVRRTFAGQPVRVLDSDGGASRARNVGAAEADTAVVAFLDDDVVVDPRWLEGVLRGFGRGPDVACVTGLILPAELEAPSQVLMQQFGGFDKGARPVLFDLDENMHPHPLYPYLPGLFGSGANVVVRRELFEGLGGFDPRLGPGTPSRGGEDIDLLLRAVLAGARVAYEPQSLVHHHHRVAEERQLRSTMYGYGAGLGAVLVKQAATGGGLEIARRVPQGLRYLLSQSSPKNARVQEGYPAGLRLAELAGLATAPVTFLRGRSLGHSEARG